jgi:putative zinc finger/helix-turn-helix YgiT family protein
MKRCEHPNLSVVTVSNFPYELKGVGKFTITKARVVKCEDCGATLLLGEEVEKWHKEIEEALSKASDRLKHGAIVFLRKRLRLDQAAFANVLGVDQSTVSRWESGATRISPTAENFLKVLVAMEPSERKMFIQSRLHPSEANSFRKVLQDAHLVREGNR